MFTPPQNLYKASWRWIEQVLPANLFRTQTLLNLRKNLESLFNKRSEPVFL